MPLPVTLSKVLPAKDNGPQEQDRPAIRSGEVFVMTHITIDPNTKYGEIVRIDGYDLIGNIQIKRRTTSKAIARQCKGILNCVGSTDGGKLKQEVKVKIGTYQTPKGLGLVLEDPA